MKFSLDSKTFIGLAFICLLATLYIMTGKFTAEAADFLKWIGGSFMAVRTAANIAENIGKKE